METRMRLRLASPPGLSFRPEVLFLDEPTASLEPEGLPAPDKFATELPTGCFCRSSGVDTFRVDPKSSGCGSIVQVARDPIHGGS
jgi:ABC-type transporter Mla maintaining outer membrane lipid asymmetry ATPase subunit MlaF